MSAHRSEVFLPGRPAVASLTCAASPGGASEVLARCHCVVSACQTPPFRRRGRTGRRLPTLLTDRRMLVLLDDAGTSAAGCGPLPAAAQRAAVIITSRPAPTDLAAPAAQHRVLDQDEARRLFTAIVGGERVSGEPDANRSCARLLRLATWPSAIAPPVLASAAALEPPPRLLRPVGCPINGGGSAN